MSVGDYNQVVDQDKSSSTDKIFNMKINFNGKGSQILSFWTSHEVVIQGSVTAWVQCRQGLVFFFLEQGP
jgi:hypothetical protein